MQPHGWTAQPAPPPALTQTAALVEEPQVLLILLGSSLWEEKGQSSGSPEGITPRIACGSSWILWSQLFVAAALLLLTALAITTTVVASLPPAISPCPGDCPLALLGHCGSVLSPPRTLQPLAARNTELQGSPGRLQLQSCSGSGCILRPPMACSQHGSARRSSYPISSALSEEKEYKMLQNFPAAFSPCPSVIAIGGFLSLLLDASKRIVSLGICPGQNHSGFGVGPKAHGGQH